MYLDLFGSQPITRLHDEGHQFTSGELAVFKRITQDRKTALVTETLQVKAVISVSDKVAHVLAVYRMLSQQVSYNDLGDLYLDKPNKNHLTRNLMHRLERMGYVVTLTLQQKAA